MTTDDNMSFANAPQSITEIKSDRTNDATVATPRDILIGVLRDIDNGRINPTALIVCVKAGDMQYKFSCASPSIQTTVYMLERTKHRILNIAVADDE
jgi:hypothetical protein